MASSDPWDLSNWTDGPVTLFSALGLGKLSKSIDWSKLSLQPGLTAQVGQSAPASQNLSATEAQAWEAGQATSAQGATNQKIGQKMAAAFGWTGSQWTALQKLLTRESSWSNTAVNPSSGAYGIGQALGHGTSATKGSVSNEYGGYGVSTAIAQQANSGNAAAQIAWTLAYIKSTYGTPADAWAHEQQYGWY